jgi:hypothetical protein
MVSVKEAVAKAIEFAQNLLEPSRISGLRLEEVEMTNVKGADTWSITLSMPRQQSGMDLFAGKNPREYKTFLVNSETGQVLSMKIRELANAE